MLVESIIKRKKGTQVVLGDRHYHFLPDKDGRHVAEVKLPSHLGTLLSIKEGYRLAEVEEVAVATVAAVALTEIAEEVAIFFRRADGLGKLAEDIAGVARNSTRFPPLPAEVSA